jgi:DNA-binding transcriptional LysR family regulator
MLDLRRLRVLRELDARGTVHGTARALGYTPSAISQQLAALEREAGLPLLERAGRTLRLTDAGRAAVRHAAVLLDAMEAAEAELAALGAGHPAGTVRVGAFQSAFLQLVAPAVAAVLRAHPGIRVEAAEVEVTDALPALRLGHLDVLVGEEYAGEPQPVHADLRREPLLDEQVRVVLPLGHPLAAGGEVPLDALRDVAWAGTQPGTAHRAMLVRTCRRLGGFEPDIRYSSDDVLIQLELVRTTGACALLPELVFAPGAPGVLTRPLAGPGVARSVFVLTRRARTPAVEQVTRALRGRAAGLGAAGTGAGTVSPAPGPGPRRPR